MFHLIAGLILVVVACIIAAYREFKSPNNALPWYIIVFFFATFGMAGILIYVDRVYEYNTKIFTLDTEIRQEIVNNQVIKSDTIYIIKKK